MPDLLFIVQKKWKTLVATSLAAVLVAGAVLLLLPKKYLSTTTALPASSLVTDKAFVFNKNVQELYSPLGTPDELDRFLGTAQLDTLYIAVAQQHKLQQHYRVAQNEHALFNAALKLKKETSMERTEYGELQIRVWDVDRNRAAALANSLMQQLQLLHQHLQSQSNALVLQKLKEAYAGLQRDSLPGAVTQAQAAEYQNLIAQYSLMVSTNPPALLVVEAARPALTPGKPYLWPSLLLTLFAAFFFTLLAIVLQQGRSVSNG